MRSIEVDELPSLQDTNEVRGQRQASFKIRMAMPSL